MWWPGAPAAALHDTGASLATSHGMKTRIADLVTALRGTGMAVSVAEAMDAARAVAVAGVERPVLREALAATLVKDEDDRPAFLVAFARLFPAEARTVARNARDKKARRSGAAEGEGGGASSAGAPSGSGAGTPGAGSNPGQPVRPPSSFDAAARPEPTDMTQRAEQAGDTDAGAERAPAGITRRAAPARDADADRERDGDAEAFSPDRARALRTRELVRRPLRALTATEVEECATLVAALSARVRARVRRRLAPKKTGRLDFRRLCAFE